MSSFSEKAKAFYQKQIDLITEKTGYNGKLIALGLLISIVLAFINFFGKYITTIVGVLLPSYWSIKAINSEDLDDDKQWLTYWAIFGIFSLIDQFAHFILKIIPFYFIFKQIFLIWCFMPNTMGALFIYRKFVEPIFKKYHQKIDEKFQRFVREGKLRAKNPKLKLKLKYLETLNQPEVPNPVGETNDLDQKKIE